MNPVSEKKYTGDGGNEQRIFIKDARIGWRLVLSDPSKHLSNGITQYEYLESLGPRLGGQARRLLDNYVDRWDYRNEDNVNYRAATQREVIRAQWRVYYKAKAVFDLRQVQVVAVGDAPISPEDLDPPVEEPSELSEFLDIIQETFQAASAVYLEDLRSFTPLPRESLIKMADRFDEVALPLLTAKLMTPRGLALNLRRHIPLHIRRTTLSAMMRDDEKCFEQGKLLMNKDQLMALAQRKEAFLLEFEAEMRAAGQVPDPRPVEDHQLAPPVPLRPLRPEPIRPQPGKDGRDRFNNKGGEAPTAETRECHICKKVGHIAKNCPTPNMAPIIGNGGEKPPPPPKTDHMAEHKTPGQICGACNKPGHVAAQCWTAHPELVPEGLVKKRQAAMMASTRMKMRAADPLGHGYQFQGMANTFHPLVQATTIRKSPRTHLPTAAAKAAITPPVRVAATPTVRRRVEFTEPPPPTPTTTPTTTRADPLGYSTEGADAQPGFLEGYEYDGQLPQSFPHGLPPSSLEPGTSDQQFPPSNLFPEAPMGDGEVLRPETPLQTMTQLRSAVFNMQQLVSELSERLWDRATDNEHHYPKHFMETEKETETGVPAVPGGSKILVHYTPAYLDNTGGVLDAEGYVPKEVIIDTGATKVFISRVFAAAINLRKDQLRRGDKYITASGAIETPLGVSESKLSLTLCRQTPQQRTESMYVTVVETTSYDILLGIDFLQAFGGAYDTYTEKFKYRYVTLSGEIQAHELKATCHTAETSLYAYAYFTGPINNAKELIDVQGSNDHIIPVDEDNGFFRTPLQQRTASIQLLALQSQAAEATRLSKEVGAANLGRRENAVARLASINPPSLPLLLPTAS